MGSSSIVFALIAVVIFLFGLWLGFRQGRAGAQIQLDEAKDEIRELRPKAEELAAAREREKAQAEKYAEMQSELKSVFGNLAAEALRGNTQSFLDIAKEQLGAKTDDARNTLEAKELAIKNLVDPLKETLGRLDEQTRAMELRRSGAYSEVRVLIESIQNTIPASLDALKKETAQLITALRAPKTRGNWGELQLKRCVEYAGMVQYCSFSEQVTARDEEDKMLRPDMTIQLPNGREIVVDAKTPLDAFLDAGGSVDPAAQKLTF